MNKLAIGFIFLLLIFIIVFSYYSYKNEHFKMFGKVTTPCNNLNDAKCTQNNKCQVLSVDTDSSSVTICVPKIDKCDPGQEIYKDETNFTTCRDCPAGFYSRYGRQCLPCGFEQVTDGDEIKLVSEPKATACVKRSDYCSNGKYEQLDLYKAVQNEFDEMYPAPPKVTNPNNDEYVTNYYSSLYLPYDNDNFDWNDSDINDVSTVVRFDDYKISDLKKCKDDQYVSNYDFMETDKKYTKDMYTVDRECQKLTDCQPGNFIKVTKQVKDKQNISNRSCEECDNNFYSHKINQPKCLEQPFCKSGERVVGEKMNTKPVMNPETDEGNYPEITSFSKTKKLECEDCDNFMYQPKQTHRSIYCDLQSPCSKGHYFPEDNAKEAKKRKVDCKECENDTYQPVNGKVTTSCNNLNDTKCNQPNKDSYPLKCIKQPMVTKPGYCLEEKYPDGDEDEQTIGFKSRRINIITANGDEFYQDRTDAHRDQCKEHKTCNRGELISQITPVATRNCVPIPTYNLQHCEDKKVDCKYMDEENHRDMEAKDHPKCTNASGSLVVVKYDDDGETIYHPKSNEFTKYEAECKTSEEKLAYIDSENTSSTV